MSTEAPQLLKRTEEMIQAAERWLDRGAVSRHQLEAAIDAVLVVVERDHAIGPAMCDAPHPTEDLAFCELPRGHEARSGRGHSTTITRAIDW